MTGKTVAETFTRQLTNDPHRKIVRATSVDELPQLFNVLKGDMALIGPVHYWYNTCLYTMKSKQEDMKCAPASLDGHK